MCIIEKIKKTIAKNFKLIFSGTVDFLFFAQDTIQWLNFVVHYFNMKIKGK